LTWDRIRRVDVLSLLPLQSTLPGHDVGCVRCIYRLRVGENRQLALNLSVIF
jgi:hypothetical protein